MTPAGAALALLAILLQQPPARPPRDSALAHRLTLAALDQEALLHADSAIALYRAARRADSSDVTAEYYYIGLMQEQLQHPALLREYGPMEAAAVRVPGLCWRKVVLYGMDYRFNASDITRLERAAPVSTCSSAIVALQTRGADSASLSAEARGTRAAPGIPGIWSKYAKGLVKAGQFARADSVLAEGELSVGHAVPRTDLAVQHIQMRLEWGDTAGALALHRALRAAVLRDGRPGILIRYLGSVFTWPALSPNDGGPDAVRNRDEAIWERAGDRVTLATELRHRGKDLIDRGQPARAIPFLSWAIALADTLRNPELQMEVYTYRGRAYCKMGRLAEAERDGLKAVQFSAHAVRRYYKADAWHNLAHTYESEGRWPEASHAADQFVALTRGMPDPLRITSLSDAGLIRWKAGWHASARAAWEEMVRVTDELQDLNQWNLAAEYFERIGDLTRARIYYLRGLAAYPRQEGGADLGGLTRVYLQLGQLDSAEVRARAHDTHAERWPPRELPLLPDILMRQGKPLEAIRVARDWLERQLRGGNTEGATLAALQLARLQLAANQPDSALAAARRADSLAATIRLTAEQIQARTLQGLCFMRLGNSASGMRVLQTAAVLAEQHPTSNNVFEAHLALGEALAGAGQPEGALAAYHQAAHEAEHVTSGLAEDLDRAGYRERHLRPFDGAVRVLLRSPTRVTQLDDLIQWSSRRTAAALALSAAGNAGRFVEAAPVLILTGVQQRLSPHEILLDYLVLDSTVAVLAVSSDTARLVRLPVTADTLRRWVERLRRPLMTTYSGRIDLARARFDAGTAADLYSALITPLKEALRGKQRLLIVPDGPLHELAFDALVAARSTGADAANNAAAMRYLIDAFEVEYLPSPAFLRAPAQRTRSPSLAAARLLAVSYNAPGGEAELAGLREVWPRERTTLLQGPAATEHAIKPAMARFGIIHFAVHAQADVHDALASHLSLVADSIDDGFLHVNEIADQRLTASLVVLSACETQAGPILEGEGVMGLARAFLASGAGSVVATQWPVGGETATLMREFYRRLAAGEAPITALRAAQLLLRTSGRFTHPFYWAGFELIGRH
jgi:CHAT domain-containing protein